MENWGVEHEHEDWTETSAVSPQDVAVGKTLSFE